MRPPTWLAALLILFTIHQSRAEDSKATPLIVESQGNQSVFRQELQRQDLLRSPHFERMTLSEIPFYPGKTLTFDAVPLAEIFAGHLPGSESILQFHCLDGFSGPLAVSRALTKAPASEAYLAIENPDQKWPPISPAKGPATAGPYAIIWKNPKASGITIEEWPYQMVKLEEKPSLRVSYPKLFPKESLQDTHSVMKGLKVFTQNCFSCHKLNGEGTSDFGPDLNLPMSPTEYFKEPAFISLIRNPQNLRQWKNGQMKGFSKKDLPDEKIRDLISYLSYMAKNRDRKKPSPD